VTDVSELFRRYLQTRISLGEPEAVLPELERPRARHLARRAARSGLSGLADASAGASDSDDDVSSLPDPPGPAASGEPDLPAEEIDRLGREATADEIGELADLATLREVAERCTRCPLHEERQQVVFGEGSADADLVCVGEAPGAREDETGRPFVGPAGQLLDRLLLSVGFHREEVYICNVLKSRPPGNRDPRDEEIEACSPFLLRQLDLLDPKVIVAFGAFAARTLTDTTDSLGSLRERVHAFQGYPLVATYHPAALLRNRSWTRPTWDDLQQARRIVDGETVTGAAEQLGLV
jgi:DNA polymerase